MTTISKVYIGVDVSKDSLDVHIHPVGKFFKIKNSKVEITTFIKQLAKYDIAQIACEATGGYEKLLAQLLKKNQYNLWIVDPRRIKGFIIATGCKSKTDKIDAQKIAEFASKNCRDYETICKTKNEEKLQALVNRKDDLVKFLAAEKTRLKHPSHALYLTSIKKLIKTFEHEIKNIDKRIQQLIQQDTDLKEKSKLIESIPGIGKASAASLLSFVPELGKLKNKQISALIGVCPYDRQSGKYSGKKFIKWGRSAPRKTLYMCALSAIRFNFALKVFYNRLIEREKPFKVAIVAIMHKLIIIANAVIKRKELCKSV